MDILGNENTQVLEYAYLNSLYHSGVKNHLDTGILEVKGWESFNADALENNFKKTDSLPCLLITSEKLLQKLTLHF